MVTVKAPTNRHHHRGVPLKSAKDRMDIISAYQQLGSYRAAADACGTTHRTVKKVVDKFEADQAGVPPPPRAERAHNYDAVAELVAERVEKSGSRPNGCCRSLALRGTRVPDVTSGAWSQKRKRCGAAVITRVAARRCGHRV